LRKSVVDVLVSMGRRHSGVGVEVVLVGEHHVVPEDWGRRRSWQLEALGLREGRKGGHQRRGYIRELLLVR